MRNAAITVFLIFSYCSSLLAQNPFHLIGPSEVCAGVKTRYLLTATECSYIEWTPHGGTIVEHVSDTEKWIVFNSNGDVTVNFHCTSGGNQVSSALVVNVTQVNPVTTIQVLPTSKSIVSGESVELVASGAAAYDWSGGGISLKGERIFVSPTTTTEYTVVGTSALGCPSNVVKVTITVTCALGPPVVSQSSVSVCPGQRHSVIASHPSQATAGGSFNWYNTNNQLVATGNTYDYQRTVPVSESVKVSYVTSSGCESGTADVTFTPSSGGTIDGGGAFCLNGSGTLTASSSAIVGWQRSYDNGTQWNYILDAQNNRFTSTSYSFNETSTALFRVIVNTGNCEIESEVEKVEIISTSGGLTNLTFTKSECNNVHGTVLLTGYDGEIQYWMQSINGGGFQIIPETQNAVDKTTYSFVATQPTRFKAIVQNNCGTESESGFAEVKVSAFGGTVLKSGTTECMSASGTLILNGYFGTIDHWEKKDGDEWVALAHNSSTYFFDGITKNTSFRAAVKLDPCTDISYSSEVLVSVNIPKPGVLVQTESMDDLIERCAKGSAVRLKGFFQLTDYTSTATILGWEKSANGIDWTPVSGNGDKVNYEVSTTTFYRAKLFVPGCGALNSGEAIVHVNKASLGEKFTEGEVVGTYEGYSYNTNGSIILGKGFQFYANTCQDFSITINENFTIDEQDRNFVLTEVIQKDNLLSEADIPWLGAHEKISSYQYFDGLGAPLQQVARKASPTQRDIVTPIAIDAFGRQEFAYLPFAHSEDNGHFKENAIDLQLDFYSLEGDKIADTPFPFSRSIFEASSLGRVIEQGAPGVSWQPAPVIGGGRTIRSSIKINSGTENIKIWKVDETNNSYVPYSDSNYPAGTLLISVTRDENDKQVKEYKDKSGKVVLKEVQNGENWLKTYYIYNELDQLAFVLPPQAVKALPAIITDDFLQDWAFCYKYNEKQQMTAKRVPGADWVVIFYDTYNRMVMSQDGNQREVNNYSVVKYDAQNRVIMTGEWNSNISNEDIRTEILNEEDRAEEVSHSSFHGYSLDKVFPEIQSQKVLTVNYYDQYAFRDKNYFADGGMNYISELENQAESERLHGQQLGTKVKVLGANSGSKTWLVSISYFDKRYRVIQSISDNLLSGSDRASIKYDFTGMVLATLSTHTSKISGNNKTVIVREEFSYDHMGRTKSHTHKIDEGAPIVLSSSEYNELGQLVEKNLNSTGTSFLQSVDYRYNIRGWLTHINNSNLSNDGGITNNDATDQFGLELKYETGLQITPGIAQYNGNISEMLWKSKRSNLNGYSFTYDDLNRITGAAFKVKTVTGWDGAENGRYDEKITSYDLNGNILNLERKGANGDNVENGSVVKTFGMMDKLVYQYKGNQLIGVKDEVGDILFRNPSSPNSTASIKGDDFSDNTTNDTEADAAIEDTWEYRYDKNGNMTTDKNKGITSITYNLLNLPQRIEFGTNGSIEYVYSATGVKLRKLVDNGTERKTDYNGAFEYNEGTLSQIAMAEGRITPSGNNGYQYQYYLKDHLGNVRVVVDQDQNGQARIVQEDNYYPFGMRMNGMGYDNGSGNKYLYNGKELQDDFGLGMYDYGARMYDPVVGRWNGIDPLADFYALTTPYAYVLNNPTNFIDPNGMWVQTQNGWSTNNPLEIADFMRGQNALANNGGGYEIQDGDGTDNEAFRMISKGGERNEAHIFYGREEGLSSDQSNGKGDASSGGDNGSVGAPGTWESFIPVWGSGRAAINDFQNGDYGWAAFNTAMAISDVFLVKSIATAVGKGAWKLGSHTWSATRRWMNKGGYKGVKHHWAISQKVAKQYGLEPIANQPWNIRLFTDQATHMRLAHGQTYGGLPGASKLGQIWFGTPTWFKAGTLGTGGDIFNINR